MSGGETKGEWVMAVTYTKEQKAGAKASGMSLATIAVAGLEFSDTINEAERRELVQFYVDFTARHAAKRLKAEANAEEG